MSGSMEMRKAERRTALIAACALHFSTCFITVPMLTKPTSVAPNWILSQDPCAHVAVGITLSPALTRELCRARTTLQHRLCDDDVLINVNIFRIRHWNAPNCGDCL